MRIWRTRILTPHAPRRPTVQPFPIPVNSCEMDRVAAQAILLSDCRSCVREKEKLFSCQRCVIDLDAQAVREEGKHTEREISPPATSTNCATPTELPFLQNWQFRIAICIHCKGRITNNKQLLDLASQSFPEPRYLLLSKLGFYSLPRWDQTGRSESYG